MSACEPAAQESSQTTRPRAILSVYMVSPLVLQPAMQESCILKEKEMTRKPNLSYSLEDSASGGESCFRLLSFTVHF